METQLTGKKVAEEKAFVQQHLNTLGSLKVKYPFDHTLPEEKRVKKIPLVQVPVVGPPEIADSTEQVSSDIDLEIKCSKPSLTYALQASPTSTIASLKEQLIKEQSGNAPSVDEQRWLLKGKVMADSKLLREYTVKSGDKITLMLKAGSTFDPTTPTTTSTESRTSLKGHTRVPSLTLNTTDMEPPIQIAPVHSHPPSSSEQFTNTISSTDFWNEHVWQMLLKVFPQEEEAIKVFEAWFGNSKQWMTPSDVAKIRDSLGLTGMGGI